jgi:hypothetical protein
LDNREFLNIVKRCAKEYDVNLNNKEFLVLAKYNSNVVPFKVVFENLNYLHLTGLSYNLGAKRFFNDCLDNRVDLNAITYKYNAEVMELKMNALPYLTQFYKFAKNIGNYNNTGYKLKTDKILGNQSISLGLVYSKDNNNNLQDFMKPNSLIAEDSKKLTQNPTMPIISIVSKNITDKYFDTITYKSKKINIDNLHFPKEICELLTPEAIQSLSPALYKRTFKVVHQHSEAKVEITDNAPKIVDDINFDEATDKVESQPTPSVPDTDKVESQPTPSVPDTDKVENQPTPSVPDTDKVKNQPTPSVPDTDKIENQPTPSVPDTEEAATNKSTSIDDMLNAARIKANERNKALRQENPTSIKSKNNIANDGNPPQVN